MNPHDGLSKKDWEFSTQLGLRGLVLASESRFVLAWDQANILYLVDDAGRLLARWNAPFEIITAAITPDAQMIAVLGAGGLLYWFNPTTTQSQVVRGLPAGLGLALDHTGWHIAVATAQSTVILLDNRGKRVAGFATDRPFKIMHFPPGQSTLIGASELGYVACHTLQGRMQWRHIIRSSVSGMSFAAAQGEIFLATGQEGIITLTEQGLQHRVAPAEDRLTAIGTSATGEFVAVATQSQRLVILHKLESELLWLPLDQPVSALVMDSLEPSLWFGLPSGQLTKLSWNPQACFAKRQTMVLAAAGRPAVPIPATTQAGSTVAFPYPGGLELPPPALQPPLENTQTKFAFPRWSMPLPLDNPDSPMQCELKYAADVRLMALVSNDKQLRVFDLNESKKAPIEAFTSGRISGKSPGLITLPGGFAVLSDEVLFMYLRGSNLARPMPVRLYDITHACALGNDSLIIVQTSEEILRMGYDGKVLWRHRLPIQIHDMAYGNGMIAVSTEDGKLLLFNTQGQQVAAVNVSPRGAQQIRWQRNAILAIDTHGRMVRCFDTEGTLRWDRPTRFDIWQVQCTDHFLVVRDIRGLCMIFTHTGQGITGPHPIVEREFFFEHPQGKLQRLFVQGSDVCCSMIGGHELLRLRVSGHLHQVLTTPHGLGLVDGSTLDWFDLPE